MSGRQCKFKTEWKENPQFRDWLGEVSGDVHRAYCKLCRKSFDIGNMGVSALRSHAQGQGHVKISGQLNSERRMTDFMRKTSTDTGEGSSCPTNRELPTASVHEESVSNESTALQLPSTSGQRKSSETQGSLAFFSSQAVLEAEIRWVIKMVMSHYSFNSSSDISAIFGQMFPDSEIAKKFSCGATKAAYLICFGLGPYFKEQRINDIRKAPCYVVYFDECLNKVTQTEQLDVVVRHWSEREGKVVVHYFDSEFWGHTQAEKLLERIKRALSPLNPNKLLQISMDGPAVNWKLLRIFQEDKSQEDPDAPKMINLGSCGLHVLHGSFQDGERETGCKVGDVLRSLWQMFHDSPARRADFIEVTKTTTFPLKFCAHRWVEDLAVAEWAVEVWPAVQQYISSHQKLPKSKVPSSASYCTVKGGTADPLFQAKLQLFCICLFWSFLEKFQTDAPMVPFLAKELSPS